MIARFALALFVLFATSLAHANELEPELFLNRITERLVGRWPYPQEYEALEKTLRSTNCASVSCAESFFRDYIREKMKQPEFFALAYEKVTARWAYKSPPSPRLSVILADAKNAKENPSASLGRDFMLVYRTFKENRPFDDLFTSQVITDPVYSTLTAGNAAYDRYSINVSKLPMSMQTATPYDFLLETGASVVASAFDLTGHPNVSGLYSSTRFLQRYWNSPPNEYRKRAGAVFRLMTCDLLAPALQRENEKQKELRHALGLSDDYFAERSIDRLHKLKMNRHASQADCNACHTRLDPVARSMRGMRVGISGVAFKGEMSYKSDLGETKVIKGDNFQALMTEATKLPNYLDCQTNWLIEAYLGNDLDLAPYRYSEITTAIEKNKRRVKNVIEELLMLPEFRGVRPEVDEPRAFIESKKVLSNCTECHTNFLRGRPSTIKANLACVAIRLDLANDSVKRDMPPSSHYWHPEPQELETIGNWIREGAPTAVGQPLFSEDELKQVLSKRVEAGRCRTKK